MDHTSNCHFLSPRTPQCTRPVCTPTRMFSSSTAVTSRTRLQEKRTETYKIDFWFLNLFDLLICCFKTSVRWEYRHCFNMYVSSSPYDHTLRESFELNNRFIYFHFLGLSTPQYTQPLWAPKHMFSSTTLTVSHHAPSWNWELLVNIPVEGIRLLDTVCLMLGTPFAAVWSQPGVVCSKKMTFDQLTRWPIKLFKKEPLKGNWEVHLHTPTKFGEDKSKDLGGVGEQTNTQTLLEL